MKIQELLEAKKKNLPMVQVDDSDEEVTFSDPDSDKIPHIVMQLRNALDLGGDKKIKFKDGSTHKISPEVITKFLLKYIELKPSDREKMQDMASHSVSGFKEALSTNFFTRRDKSIYAYK